MSQQLEFTYKDQAPIRLDLFLSKEQPDYSRTYWKKMIEHGHVQLNGSNSKPSAALAKDDKIFVQMPDVDATYADRVAIIFEDDETIIINKPAGMLTHSKGPFNPEFSVADFIAPRLSMPQPDGDNLRAGIVHRLDRFTSGVMICAKTDNAATVIQKQFADRKTSKFYVAVVEGIVTRDEFDIAGAIARSTRNPKMMTVASGGKAATTRVQVIYRDDSGQKTVVLLQPATGRTHQLRVHLSNVGHPIVGDTLYGAQTHDIEPRFLLHARALQVQLPGTTSKQLFVADIPGDMSSYINDEIRADIDKRIGRATT